MTEKIDYGKDSLIIIGGMGDGKSEFCNYLTKTNDFPTSDKPTPETLKSQILNRNVLDIGNFLVVDTPGLDDGDNMDAKHVKEMVDEVKKLTNVKAFCFVLNNEAPRFRQSTKDTMRVFEYIFKHHLWANVCVIFSKTYWIIKNYSEKDLDAKIRNWQNIIKNTFNIDINIPCYFVESKEIEGSKERNRRQMGLFKQWLQHKKSINIEDIGFTADIEVLKLMLGDFRYHFKYTNSDDARNQKHWLYNAANEYNTLIQKSKCSNWLKGLASRKLNENYFRNPGDGVYNNTNYTKDKYYEVMNDIAVKYDIRINYFASNKKIYSHKGGNLLNTLILHNPVVKLFFA